MSRIARGRQQMANWVICTRKLDATPLYLNLDAAVCLRWNNDEQVTVVTWSGTKGDLIRVLETPEQIFKKVGQIAHHAGGGVPGNLVQGRTGHAGDSPSLSKDA